MGFNEFAGYVAVAASALATGWIAARYGLRPQPFYLGVGFVDHRTRPVGAPRPGNPSPRLARVQPRRHATARGYAHTARRSSGARRCVDANLSSVSQAGLVNNLNDGMAWGLFPLVFAAAGMDLAQMGLLAAIYPATWGFAQLVTGALSDRMGRKWLIVWGMWVQAAGIAVMRWHMRSPALLLVPCCSGLGPRWSIPRCSPRSVTSPIRRGGHPRSASIACGVTLGTPSARCSPGSRQTRSGLAAAMWVIAALTFVSGVVSATRMAETLPPTLHTAPRSTGSPGRRSLARDHTRHQRTGRSSEYAHNARRRE